MIPFYIVDVFAEQKYAGNQLAVIHPTTEMSTDMMQDIAREMNYSETTFILPRDTTPDGGYPVRIFTPNQEVPFAGHPTLGTAYIIQRELIQHPVPQVTLALKVGHIPVTLSYDDSHQPDLLEMKQIQPDFGTTLAIADVAPALGLREDQFLPDFPIQDVTTGLPFFITPLRDLAAVQQCRVNQEKLLALVEHTRAKAFFVFAPEAIQPDNQIHGRMFGHFYNVPEDPATGSANGCLAAYLVEHGYFGTSEIEVRVEQGYEIQRPSQLYLRAKKHASGQFDLFVGGKAVLVARGELVLPQVAENLP